MSSDVVLEEGKIKIVDGTLEVDRNAVFKGGLKVESNSDRATISPGRMMVDTVSANRSNAREMKSRSVEVGTATPEEPSAAGVAWVNDKHGAERIYLNGGEGAAEETGTETEGTTSEGGLIPGRIRGRWGTFPIPRRNSEAITEQLRRTRTHDERGGAPERVRVYIEGDAGSIGLGGDGVDGDLVVTDGDGETTVHINGYLGDITVKGHDQPLGAKIHALEERIEQLEGDQ